jgi:hypothetical protein
MKQINCMVLNARDKDALRAHNMWALSKKA